MQRMSFDEFCETAQNFKAEAAKRIVGCEEAVEQILAALVAGGHVLLEGAPGLAKTLVARTFADISGLSFKRIQFTPDLLPADLTGSQVYSQQTGEFSVRKGPIFANFVLADEINRAGAKVQSALLEAMAESQVSIAGETFSLPSPFFVMATQNPIDQDGVFSLPEAERDRFLLKVLVDYPKKDDEIAIVKRALEGDIFSIPVENALDAQKILKMRAFLSEVKCDERLLKYIVSICRCTRGEIDADFLRGISFGASPRASVALALCAKASAAFDGRDFVLPEDIQKFAPPVLRHRLALSYEAAALRLSEDEIIQKILRLLPIP